jgi:hypothetical protein
MQLERTYGTRHHCSEGRPVLPLPLWPSGTTCVPRGIVAGLRLLGRSTERIGILDEHDEGHFDYLSPAHHWFFPCVSVTPDSPHPVAIEVVRFCGCQTC